jgi:ferredoxin-fold anticodon binding domain-containing protein
VRSHDFAAASAVGAETVGVVEERVTRAVVVLERCGDTGPAKLRLETLRLLERDELVSGPKCPSTEPSMLLKSGLP